MKKFYTLLVATLLASTTFGQRSYDLQLDLVTPASGSDVAPGSIAVEFTLTNNGPDAVVAGDTVMFSYVVATSQTSQTIYSLQNNATNNVTGVILPAGVSIPVGGTFSSALLTAAGLMVPFTLSSAPEGAMVFVVCHGLGAAALTETGDTNDTDAENNADYFFIGAPAVSISNVSTSTFAAYPNPATDVLNITSEEEITSINVLSLDGKIVATSNGASVNVSTLTSGVYVYQVTSISGATTANKFVKK